MIRQNIILLPDAQCANDRMYTHEPEMCVIYWKRFNLIFTNFTQTQNMQDVIADIDLKQTTTTANEKNEAWMLHFQFISMDWSGVVETPTEFMKFNYISQSDSFDRFVCYCCCCCCCGCSTMWFVQTNEWKNERTTSRNWNLNKKVHNEITASHLIIKT